MAQMNGIDTDFSGNINYKRAAEWREKKHEYYCEIDVFVAIGEDLE